MPRAQPAPFPIVRSENSMMVSIVILAAGAARRMGACKQLLPLGGRPLIWQTAYQACQSDAAEVIVISGAYADQLETALVDLPVKTVYNPYWSKGQAESVKAGIAAVRREAKAVIFLPADQPLITAEFLNTLINVFRTGPSSIIAPVANGRRGAPVLFDLQKWKEYFCELSGDQGARRLLDKFPDEVEYITVQDKTILWDADTPEQYRLLQKVWTDRKEQDEGKRAKD